MVSPPSRSAGKTDHHRVRKGPWLALVIADIFHLQAYFFHYFPAYTFFKCLAHFHITCDQCIPAVSASCIPGHKQFVPISDSYDHSRTDLWILCMSAICTHHGPFCSPSSHLCATAAAEPPAFSPTVDLASCNTCKRLIPRFQFPEDLHSFQAVAAKFRHFQIIYQIIASFTDGKQIVRLFPGSLLLKEDPER